MLASGGAESDVELRAGEGESGKFDHHFVRQPQALAQEHEQEHEHDGVGEKACSGENSVRSPGGQEGSVEEDGGQEAASLSRERSPPGLARLTRHRDGEMKTCDRTTIGSRGRSTAECSVEPGIGRIAEMHESVDADVIIGSDAEFGTESGRIGNDTAIIGYGAECGTEPGRIGNQSAGIGSSAEFGTEPGRIGNESAGIGYYAEFCTRPGRIGSHSVGIGYYAESGTEPGRIFGNDAAGIGSDVEVRSEPEIAGREVEGRGQSSAAERRTGGVAVGVPKGDGGIEWCHVDSERKE